MWPWATKINKKLNKSACGCEKGEVYFILLTQSFLSFYPADSWKKSFHTTAALALPGCRLRQDNPLWLDKRTSPTHLDSSYWLLGLSITGQIAETVVWQLIALSVPSGEFTVNDNKVPGGGAENRPGRLKLSGNCLATHLLTSFSVIRRGILHTPTHTQLSQVESLPHLVPRTRTKIVFT